jgi:hypothetical protein
MSKNQNFSNFNISNAQRKRYCHEKCAHLGCSCPVMSLCKFNENHRNFQD